MKVCISREHSIMRSKRTCSGEINFLYTVLVDGSPVVLAASLRRHNADLVVVGIVYVCAASITIQLALDAAFLLYSSSIRLAFLHCISACPWSRVSCTYSLSLQKLSHLCCAQCVDISIRERHWAGASWDDQERLECIWCGLVIKQ